MDADLQDLRSQIATATWLAQGAEASAATDRPAADAGCEVSRWHVARAERSAARCRARAADLQGQLPQPPLTPWGGR